MLMLKQKSKLKTIVKLPKIALIAVALVFAFGIFATVKVAADQFDQKINQLQQANNKKLSALDQLKDQASSYQDAINKLQAKINALQSAINQNVEKQAQLQKKIIELQAQIAKEKKVLGESIKSMYVQGDISTLEMLASSKDLSDFVDKEVYQSTVRDKIKGELDEITRLKAQVQKQKDEIDALIKDLQKQKADLAEAKAAQDKLLNYNQAQQNSFNKQIAANQAQIDNLRQQQAIENAKLFGGGIVASGNCGGGYPRTARGPWGNWGCNYALDYNIDNWGMYNRECVSYTAYRVAASGRHMPYWGGVGNANMWDDNARSSGIPVDRSPRAGDVAISNNGFYGHAMYVEAVYGDGTILISQFNGDWHGTYSMARIYIGSLVFIHFR